MKNEVDAAKKFQNMYNEIFQKLMQKSTKLNIYCISWIIILTTNSFYEVRITYYKKDIYRIQKKKKKRHQHNNIAAQSVKKGDHMVF